MLFRSGEPDGQEFVSIGDAYLGSLTRHVFETLAHHAQIALHVRVLGGSAGRRTHWLFAVVADDPDALVAAGRAAGFDLTRGSSTLVALDPACAAAREAMAGVVYLPADPGMTDAQLDRLAAVVSAATPHPLAQRGRSSTGCSPDRKSTRLNSSHSLLSRMPSSA